MTHTLLKRTSFTLACLGLALLTPLFSNPKSPAETPKQVQTVQLERIKGKIEVSHKTVVRGSTIVVKGWLPQRGGKVKLQKFVGADWRTVKELPVGQNGRFRTKLTINKRTLLRGYSSKFTNLSTLPISVKTVNVRASLTPIPPLGGAGLKPNVKLDKAQILATFTPPIGGQEVVLERKTAKQWVPVAVGHQTQAGSVALPAKPGEEYRVRAGAYHSAPIRAESFPLLFREDFSTFDSSIWTDQPRVGASGRSCGVSSPQARRMGRGVLKLGVITDPQRTGEVCSYLHNDVEYKSPYLLSSQVATSRSFSFTYGYAAARVRMHSNPGTHFGFWMLPYREVLDPTQLWNDVSFVPGDPTQGAEVDIVEYWAHNSNGQEPRIGSFLHWYGVDGLLVHSGYLYPEANRMKSLGETWDNSYHVYAVRWTPDYYEFMVDGHVYARVEENVTQVPEYLVLSMLASDYELNKRNSYLQDEADVDWVRVWGLQ